jgi:DNA-damage-inducible protein J
MAKYGGVIQKTTRGDAMKTALVQARIDEKLKKSADAFFERVGMDTATAIRMFLINATTNRALPFKVEEPEPAYNPEFVKTVLASDEEYHAGKGTRYGSVDEAFADILGEGHA